MKVSALLEQLHSKYQHWLVISATLRVIYTDSKQLSANSVLFFLALGVWFVSPPKKLKSKAINDMIKKKKVNKFRLAVISNSVFISVGT